MAKPRLRARQPGSVIPPPRPPGLLHQPLIGYHAPHFGPEAGPPIQGYPQPKQPRSGAVSPSPRPPGLKHSR